MSTCPVAVKNTSLCKWPIVDEVNTRYPHTKHSRYEKNLKKTIDSCKPASLHGGGGPQVREVTCLPMPHVSYGHRTSHVNVIKLIDIWKGGLHLSGLPHLPGVPHLHVNRP